MNLHVANSTMTHPLINILVQSITEGVHFLCQNIQWAYQLEIDTLCVNGLQSIFYRGSVHEPNVIANELNGMNNQ